MVTVLFGSLLDLFVSGLVVVSVLSAFEFNAVLFMGFLTEVFDRLISCLYGLRPLFWLKS